MSAPRDSDLKTFPYWWNDCPRPEWPHLRLPEKADVAIVGSGYTGLNAAIALARGGRQVVVLEAGSIGNGASTRLAGFIGRSLNHSLPHLQKQYGLKTAVRMLREAGDAHFFLLDWIRQEKIDAKILYRGRFTAAHRPEAYESMARNAELLNKHVPLRFSMCPRSEQTREIGSDFYFGGLVVEEHGTLHPASYHQGLVSLALQAGVTIVANCSVRQLSGCAADGFILDTELGSVHANDVLIATNGYTREQRNLSPWLRRRVIPVAAYQIATEPLSKELMKSVKPTGRAFVDSKRNTFWDRPTPDDQRLIFGGRTGSNDGSLSVTARKLRNLLVQVYPQLAASRIDYVWQGTTAFTFDKLPHMGQTADGVYFAGGYCAQGLPIGTLFGHHIAQRILGKPVENDSVFWNREFPTWPFYGGEHPWFMPIVMGRYNLLDGFELLRNKR
jgi:glycine/D-amino acid oxidase-like deaminating enzyme